MIWFAQRIAGYLNVNENLKPDAVFKLEQEVIKLRAELEAETKAKIGWQNASAVTDSRWMKEREARIAAEIDRDEWRTLHEEQRQSREDLRIGFTSILVNVRTTVLEEAAVLIETGLVKSTNPHLFGRTLKECYLETARNDLAAAIRALKSK